MFTLDLPSIETSRRPYQEVSESLQYNAGLSRPNITVASYDTLVYGVRIAWSQILLTVASYVILVYGVRKTWS
jgi:hypothetical protein